MTEKQQSGDGPLSGAVPTERGEGGSRLLSGEAAEALERLRTVIDEAAQTVRELSETSRQWAEDRQSRTARLRSQSERAVATLSRRVEDNMLTGVALAAAIGVVAGLLTRR